MSIRFTTIDGVVEVPKIWANRWQTLKNLVDEFSDQDVVEVPYTYTDKKVLEQWDTLNLAMDVQNVEVHWDASQLWKVVEFMDPVDSSWSDSCDIDDKLEDKVRKVLYEHLGRRIRKEGAKSPAYLRYPWQRMEIQQERKEQTVNYSSIFEAEPIGNVDFFYLHNDPIYGVIDSEEVHNRLLSNENLNILTGIYYNLFRRGPITLQSIPWKEIALFTTYWDVLCPADVDDVIIDKRRETITDNHLPWLLADIEPPHS